jgi:hypothetical protein
MMTIEVFLLMLITIASLIYVTVYVGQRKYLQEDFQVKDRWGKPDPKPTLGQKGSGVQVGEFGSGKTDESPQIVTSSATVTLTPTNTPYDTGRINDLGDYEMNYIYSNESDKPLEKKVRDQLMSQRPMDWTGYPPSSSQFQAGLRESFENAKPHVPDDAKPYENVSGDNMSPPDMSAVEKDERKILQTYKPTFPPTATSYDPRDAAKLIKELYDAKGLIPQVKHKEGTNVYEIVGTRKKGEKVVYEDEAAATTTSNASAGEGNIQVPYAVNDMMTSTKDNFYDKAAGKKNPWDYTSWTPGLERMFAPSEPRTEW